MGYYEFLKVLNSIVDFEIPKIRFARAHDRTKTRGTRNGSVASPPYPECASQRLYTGSLPRFL